MEFYSAGVPSAVLVVVVFPLLLLWPCPHIPSLPGPLLLEKVLPLCDALSSTPIAVCPKFMGTLALFLACLNLILSGGCTHGMSAVVIQNKKVVCLDLQKIS